MAKTAPIAPMPTDPAECRWCGGRRMDLGNGTNYCPHGCLKNDIVVAVNRCSECRRDFETGDVRADLCHECKTKEAARYQQETALTEGRRGYLGDQLRQAVNRRVTER